MKIYVDISVFLKQKRSLGQIFGNIELPCIPVVGASIAFSSPAPGILPVVCEGFSGALKVTDVQLIANASVDNIVISLEDIVLSNESNSKALMEYFRNGFGLFVDEA